MLADAVAALNAPAFAGRLGWACRICAGLPAPRSWPLSPQQRLDNKLDKAVNLERRPSEKLCEWRRVAG